MKRLPGFCYFLLLAAGWSFAQGNEVSLSAGATFTSSQTLTTTFTPLIPCTTPNCNVFSDVTKASTAFTFQASYARRLAGAGPLALYIELPVVGTPGHGVGTVFSSSVFGPFNGSTSSALFFFTPSARVKFFSSAKISPWVTAGGGWARLTQGSQNVDKGVVQFGGGLDFKTGVPHLGLRGEVRDFWSGGVLQSAPVATGVAVGLPGGPITVPPVQVTVTNTISPTHQHHVFAGGGVVLRF